MKIKSKLQFPIALAIMSFAVFSMIFQGCEKEDIVDTFELEELKAEYGLKTMNDNNVIEFHSINEARLFLERLKENYNKTYKVTFSLKSPKEGSFHSSYEGSGYSGNRLKSGTVEEIQWDSVTDAGNWSSYLLTFNTSGNNVIDKGSISINVTGFVVGWTFTQNNVTMLDSDSFIVSGTILYGIGIANIPFGYTQTITIQIDINWQTEIATWTIAYNPY